MKSSTIGGFVLGCLALLGLGAVVGSDAIHEKRFKNGVLQASKDAVNEYIRNNPISINNDIIEEAVRSNTAARVASEIDKVSNQIRTESRNRIRTEVEGVLNSERSTYASRIKDELDRAINKTDIQEAVIDEVREKFQDKLDEIVDREVSGYVNANGPKIIKDRTDAHLRRRYFDTPW